MGSSPELRASHWSIFFDEREMLTLLGEDDLDLLYFFEDSTHFAEVKKDTIPTPTSKSPEIGDTYSHGVTVISLMISLSASVLESPEADVSTSCEASTGSERANTETATISDPLKTIRIERIFLISLFANEITAAIAKFISASADNAGAATCPVAITSLFDGETEPWNVNQFCDHDNRTADDKTTTVIIVSDLKRA